MSATLHPASPPTASHTRGSWLHGTDGVGPVLIMGLLLALLVGSGVAGFHGNLTGFVRFGHDFVAAIRPPHGAIIDTHAGNDGQYFWVFAHDPLILRGHTLAAFATQTFRLQRVAYPALAYLLAAGHAGLLPWSLLAVNIGVVLGATLAFGVYARRRGWSGWWGLALGLLPGFGFAVLGDFSDALAVTAMLGGMIAWRHGRPRPAAALLTLAVLAREPMMLAVAAIVIQVALDARRPSAPDRVRRAWAALWPTAVVPVLAFGAWQVYIAARVGGSTSAPGTAFAAPFTGIITEAGHAMHNDSAIHGAWDLMYLGLMVVGLGVAAAMVRTQRSAPAIAALLFGLTLLVLTFGYAWSYTRLSAPMFACLLLVGLERRHRVALPICVVVATLGVLLPLATG
ncbi:MAG: hypothetical protein WBQ18_11035 [Solirubrobacteraceae bacterium]